MKCKVHSKRWIALLKVYAEFSISFNKFPQKFYYRKSECDPLFQYSWLEILFPVSHKNNVLFDSVKNLKSKMVIAK